MTRRYPELRLPVLAKAARRLQTEKWPQDLRVPALIQSIRNWRYYSDPRNAGTGMATRPPPPFLLAIVLPFCDLAVRKECVLLNSQVYSHCIHVLYRNIVVSQPAQLDSLRKVVLSSKGNERLLGLLSTVQSFGYSGLIDMGHVNGALALRQLRSIPGRYYRSNDTNRNSNSGIASELYFPNLRKAIIRIFDHGDTTNAGAFWSSPTFSRPNSQPAAANSEDEETSCFLSQVEELVIDKWTSFMSGTSLFPFDYLAMENVTCVRLSPRYIESGAKNIFRLLRRAKQLRTIVLDLRGGLDQLQKALTTLTQRLDQLSRIEHVVLDPHSQRLELDSLISRRAYHENTFYQRYAKELVDTVRELENEVDVNEFPLLQQLVLQIRVRHESIIHYFWSQITTSTPSDSQLKLDKAFLEDKVSWARLP